jgi:type IV secretion system protein VirD4
LLLLSGQWSSYEDPWFYAWWNFLYFYPDNKLVLLIGAGMALLAILIASRITYTATQKVHGWPLRLAQKEEIPPTIKAGTDHFGHAHFETMEVNGKRWPDRGDPLYGGLVVGEAYDPQIDHGAFDPRDPESWGHGGTAPLLIDDLRQGSTHSIEFGGSGAGKTLSVVIPNLLTFRGPVVCMDPKQNLAERVREAREAMGKRVVVLEPGRMGFNALSDCLDPTSDTIGIDIDGVVETVCGYTSKRDPKSAFFKDEGKAIVKALIAHLVWNDNLPSALRSLETVRRQIAAPADELTNTLKFIAANSASPIARDLARAVSKDQENAPEMFAGFHRSATRDTDWLGDPAYVKMVSGSAFRAADILDGTTDVFIAIPLIALEANSAPARCIMGSLMNAVYNAKGNFPAGRVLFEIEEAKRVGRMNILAVARDVGREFGITMNLVYQSPGQMEEDWGRDGKQTWYDSARRSYSAINSVETAEEVVRSLGEYGIVNLSESQNVGSSRVRPLAQRSRSWGKNVTHSWGRRELKKAVELMYDLRSDAKIVIPQPGTGWPALCGMAFVPRRPEMLARVKGIY